MAIAPPFGLTRASLKSTLISLRQPSTWLAKASLISMISMSPSDRPARSSARGMAYAGPTPMTRGSTPALAAERMRAIGLRLRLSPHFLLAIISAAAPSLIPEALRSEEHTSELQSPCNLVCRLLLEKKKSLDQKNTRLNYS